MLPGVLGAVFAVSGLRALVLSLPLWNASGGVHHFWSLLFLVTVFALGILLSMSLFGIAFARFMTAAAAVRLGQAAAVLMAVASIALGVFWIAQA